MYKIRKLPIKLYSLSRLARYFGSSEKFWLGLQDDYDLEEASKKMGEALNRISAVA